MNLRGNDVRAVVIGGAPLVLGLTASAAGPGHGPAPLAANDAGNAGRGGRNLLVSVPPAPAPSALRPLCHDLIAGRLDKTVGPRDRGTNTVPALIAATGGTTTGALNWCHIYLQHRRVHR
jgi:hypothetical protein